ncbi:MAG: sigma-54-dependent transcriptional regulator [Candidatus Sifarchaeia archaeon]|jgi:DNA-binding NtrC family response regulator
MKKKTKVLIADDEAVLRESIRDWLCDAGFEVLVADDGLKALQIIERERPSIAIVDLVMPGIDGIELLKRAKEAIPSIEVILITAYASIPTAIAAIKEGAYDYIEKPFSPHRVELLINKLVERQELIKENISLHRKLEKRYRFENIITKSSRMKQVIELIKVVASSNATVLIMGESGTGKELVARAIHSQSNRKEQPFIAVSCAALPESLLESELFGHEKGAFTGAYSQRKGKIEMANRGTLFLDEIGDMSANIQVHLLRVLEEREFTRVGGNELIKSNVRVVSATNKDLKKAIASKQFREDLYYRLNVVTIDLPALRDRREDILLLADYFMAKFMTENQKEVKGFSQEVTKFLLKYHWPGNVRELENTIERAVILTQNPYIEMTDLLQKTMQIISVTEHGSSLKELEKDYIKNILGSTGGKLSESARILGISRATLYNKIKVYGLDVH